MEGALALPELKYPVQGRTLLSHVLCRSDITRMRKRIRPAKPGNESTLGSLRTLLTS